MTYDSEVTTDAPELWWKLHDAAGSTTYDDAANSHDGGIITQSGANTLGLPGLVAGGGTCLKLYPLSGGDIVRSVDQIGPSTNFSLEMVVRPYDTDYTLFWQKEGSILEGVMDAGDTPGLLVAASIVGSGLDQRTSSMTALAVGQRTHLVWEFVGTSGVIGAGAQKLRVYLNGTAVVDSAVGTSNDYDFQHDNGYIQFAGWSLYVEHVAYYTHELTSTRIAAHIAAMGDVLGFGEAVEADSGRQIGFPRNSPLDEAGLPTDFDLEAFYGPGGIFTPAVEIAQPVRPVGGPVDGTVPLGRAVETDSSRPMAHITIAPQKTDQSDTLPKSLFPPRRIAAR